MIKQHEHRVMRGFRFRLYTTPVQDERLREMADTLRRCWNWLCSVSRQTSDAREAYAARELGPKPMPPRTRAWTPEERGSLKEWTAAAKRICDAQPACAYRSIKDWQDHFGVKHPYQIFRPALGLDRAPAPAHLLDSLVKDWQAALTAVKRGSAPPRRKRPYDSVTLRARSGRHFRLGSYGARPGKRSDGASGRADWLNCDVDLPGIGHIAGHLGGEQLARLETSEYWVEGVSVVEEPDGWYAAIRQWIPDAPRPLAQDSPESRWRGYGLPVRDWVDGGTPRASDWQASDYRGWIILVRDRGPAPAGLAADEIAVELDHRWRVAAVRPDGHRIDLRKGCPTYETALTWARERIDRAEANVRPGTRAQLDAIQRGTQSPRRYGGERVLGTDAGLVSLLTIDAGQGDELWSGNSRCLDLLEEMALRQTQELPVGLLHCRAARRVRHLSRGVLAWLREARPDSIAIAATQGGQSEAKWIAQEGHGRTRRSGGYTPGAGWILAQVRAEYGDRVREVTRATTVGECSQCGHSPDEHDPKRRVVECPECEAADDQDRVAARRSRAILKKSRKESRAP